MEEARNPLNRGLIETLKSTQRRFGSIYPVIMTEEGEVIDGRHRLQAGWDEAKRLPIKDRKDIIALRLVLNASRRIMPPEEKCQLVNELASLLLSRNVKMDQLVEAISAETGFSTRWVYKYLDKKFKRKTKPSNPKEIAYHAISPYRRIVLYLSNEKARLLDALTTQKGFKELSDTILWLIDEALRLVGKSIPEVRS